MNMTEYQLKCKETAVYPCQHGHVGLMYVTLKLNGEAGEVAELVGKALRDDEGMISNERREKLAKELGDVLWYVAMIADELDLNLGEVARLNLEKLASRKERNNLHGSGSDR